MSSRYTIDEVSNLEAMLMDGSSVTVHLYPSTYSDCTSTFDRDEGYEHTEEHHLDSKSHKDESNSRNKKDGIVVPHVLGDDGNLHYCAICLDVGEVVCCDGCPKVYHINCIPLGCKSRIDLDADVDPWYCPECLNRGGKVTKDIQVPVDESEHKPTDSTPLPLNFGNRRAAKEVHIFQSTPPKESMRHRNTKSTDSVNRKKRKTSIDGNHDEPTKKKREYERTASGLVKILPPFHYYLLDHKERINRQLAKKMRGIKDGTMDEFEHNYEIAKEAMLSWRRASEKERQRYIDHSIDEFEENVIEWKEDETIRKMLENKDDDEINANGFGQEDDILEEDNFWKRKVKALTSGCKVETKRVKGHDSNQVLVELLQDSRFHPIPMLQPNREEDKAETVDDEGKNVSNFHVSGPIATGVGDECLGCTRGWNHFCPIVGRPLPAVEWRANLQPPESSLFATRIGLGLPHIENQRIHIDGLTSGLSLVHPSKRGDQILDIIDRLIAAKSSGIHRDTTKTYLCENCKRYTRNNNGCFSCRRLKIISEEAAKVPAKDPRPKIQTVMLPRQYNLKNNFVEQSQSDKRVAEHLTRNKWNPNVILPRSFENYVSNDILLISKEDEEMPEINKNDSNSGDFDDSRQLTRRYLRRGSPQHEDLCTDSISQENAEAHREEAMTIQNKCLFIAMSQILMSLLKRDPMKLFAKPVSKEVEGYHNIIKNPIDFSIIEEKVVKGEYRSLGAFAADVKLLCINSQIYNPPGTIYYTTAEEIATALEQMTKRASDWMTAIKNAHASFYSRKCKPDRQWKTLSKVSEDKQDMDPFYGLRKTWPGAIELLEIDENQMKTMLNLKFLRNKENEMAYYGALALRRSAVAIDASFAPLFKYTQPFLPGIYRSADNDEELRKLIDHEVSSAASVHNLETPPSITEMHLLEIVKKIQKQRAIRKITPGGLCSRCVPKGCHDESKIIRRAEIRCSSGSRKRKMIDEHIDRRVDKSRLHLSSGLASKVEQKRINAIDTKSHTRVISQTRVRGSNIQGWGLYAERRFTKDDIVAEYMGEYVQNPVADKREKIYEDNRIQDYQFRVSYELVIDATKHGGFARYINHSCDPNCVAKIIDGEPPNQHLKRVIVVAQQDIKPGEEITYDYQFPIELDLSQRIPCSCGATKCRGYMNWDINDSISSIKQQDKKKVTGRKSRSEN